MPFKFRIKYVNDIPLQCQACTNQSLCGTRDDVVCTSEKTSEKDFAQAMSGICSAFDCKLPIIYIEGVKYGYMSPECEVCPKSYPADSGNEFLADRKCTDTEMTILEYARMAKLGISCHKRKSSKHRLR